MSKEFLFLISIESVKIKERLLNNLLIRRPGRRLVCFVLLSRGATHFYMTVQSCVSAAFTLVAKVMNPHYWAWRPGPKYHLKFIAGVAPGTQKEVYSLKCCCGAAKVVHYCHDFRASVYIFQTKDRTLICHDYFLGK